MAGFEVISIEINAAGRDPGLIDAGELADHLCGGAVVVEQLIAQVRGDLHRGLAQHGGAVRPEADGVIPTVGAQKFPFRHNQADGQAGGGVEKVAVHAGNDPVSFGFQALGGRGDRDAGSQSVTIGDNGRHIFIGGIGHHVFCPQIRICGTPEHVGGKLCLLVEQRVPGGEILAQGIGRGGADAQGTGQRCGKEQGQCPAEKTIHKLPPSVSRVVNITFFRIAQKRDKVNAEPETNPPFRPEKCSFFLTKQRPKSSLHEKGLVGDRRRRL